MPLDLPPLLAGILFAVAWVGHTCIWVALMNFLFGCPIPKLFLKSWRWVTAALLFSFPLLLLVAEARPVLAYLAVCLTFGGVVFPAITLYRRSRKLPAEVAITDTKSFDFWKTLGPPCLGDGTLRAATRLPGNDIYKFDITTMTVTLPNIPAAWDGLTLLLVSDTHFYGTPGRWWWDAVFDELTALPTPDVVLLGGDYVDTDAHIEWVAALFGRLKWNKAGFAILGNHDILHRPERVRDGLRAAGYEVLGNSWQEVTIRGEQCVVIGHEGPWFKPPPDLSDAPTGVFRLCLSHTPDNLYWGVRNGIDLMLGGHTHGGGVVFPVVGPIFTPSKFGRRFDLNAYKKDGTLMVLSRGLSGKEPVRFRCPPQAVRIVLRTGSPDAS
jgi:hypothetical protein